MGLQSDDPIASGKEAIRIFTGLAQKAGMAPVRSSSAGVIRAECGCSQHGAIELRLQSLRTKIIAPCKHVYRLKDSYVSKARRLARIWNSARAR